ncbi:MAG: alpha/beta fold hydrolase, partial [Acidimicrobiales bacterium]
MVTHAPKSLQRLPEGGNFELSGRGTTWARVLPGDPGSTAVLLLHGWTATADLNWAGVYEALWPEHTVIAPDHHGHGRGLRREGAFTIADTADDAAALVRHLGFDQVIVVGYSMGGAVAQEFARRHPTLTTGLVLCAT